MEQAIKDRYSEDILAEALARYGIGKQDVNVLDGFESYLYDYHHSKQEYILRISHSRRRTVEMILGEVDWINYLTTRGVSASPAAPSTRGELVEIIEDGQGGQFLATSFIKAPGKAPWEARWTPDRYEGYGRLIGRMHALSKDYRPTDKAWKRPACDEPPMLDADINLPKSEGLAIKKFGEVVDHIKALPKDPASFAMIHYDAHEGNFLMDEEGKITLFDFDDCCYGWFICDIAILLFYKILFADDKPALTRYFMRHFLRGYCQENALDPVWLKEIPVFLKLREIDLYGVIHRSYNLETMDDPWNVRYMAGRKERIEKDLPFLDFDFESLSEYLE